MATARRLSEIVRELNEMIETYGDIEVVAITDEGENATIDCNLEDERYLTLYN